MRCLKGPGMLLPHRKLSGPKQHSWEPSFSREEDPQVTGQEQKRPETGRMCEAISQRVWEIKGRVPDTWSTH